MSERVLSRWFVVVLVLAVAIPFAARPGGQARAAADRCLVPASIREPILNEVSGEQARSTCSSWPPTAIARPQEYQDQYFETTYIRDMAKQYGLSDVQVDFFPTRDTWDAEEGDLWLVQPTKEKIASITMVPTALAQGSKSADVEAEVVYVGLGREADYAGKDVKGKIVLRSGSFRDSFSGALQRGAVGALGTGSPGIDGDAAGATLDQIGWASVSPGADRDGFGWALSLRQFLDLRNMLERGQKVVMRAHIRTRTYPGKMNVVSAAIPGTDPNAGELILVAHAFETIATPGANDNCTGVATILEVGRTLARLIRDGTLPKPVRTIRFLWVPEISGSTAFMFKHPELQDKLLVALNFDMTGANPKTTDSYLRMKMTPDSRPSYLNDLIASLLQFVDQTNVRSQQGQNAQFNYRLSPVAAITSGQRSLGVQRRRHPRDAVQLLARQLLQQQRGSVRLRGPDRIEARRVHGRIGVLLPRHGRFGTGARPCVRGDRERREVDRRGDAAVRSAAGRRRGQAGGAVQGCADQGGRCREPREGRRGLGAGAGEGCRCGHRGEAALSSPSTPRTTRIRSCWNRGTPTRPPRSVRSPRR